MQRSQWHKKDAVLKAFLQIQSQLSGKASFSCASNAGQREQTHVRAGQQLRDRGELFFTSNQSVIGTLGTQSAFQRRRKVWISEFVRIKVYQGQRRAVFPFHFAKFVQMRPPAIVLRQIVRYSLRKKDMPGIGACHHLLGQVDSSPGEIYPIVNVFNLIDRAAMNSHS